MKVTLLYFAAARDRVGRSSETLYLLAGATAGDALEAACVGHPELRPLASKLRLAVDQTFCPPTLPLRDGCEVALIPPVSGGWGGGSGAGWGGGRGGGSPR